jgi:hypothetical protein
MALRGCKPENAIGALRGSGNRLGSWARRGDSEDELFLNMTLRRVALAATCACVQSGEPISPWSTRVSGLSGGAKTNC